jgi:hypothetical protein
VHGWGLPAAIVAFLLTCLGGHPLLTPEVAYPFWIAVGLAAASAPAARPLGRWARRAAEGAILVYAAWVPIRAMDAVQHANLANTTIGLSQWQREPDGTRFRWAGPRSTFFFESSATGIVIPLRHGPDGPPALVARISLDGREANRVEVHEGEAWFPVPFRFLTGQRPGGGFRRIDIDVMAPGVAAGTQGQSRLLAIAQPVMRWDAGGGMAPESDVPLLADMDGDGLADLVVWSPATGTWRWLTSSSGYDDRAARSTRWEDQGLGSIPLLADLDGDGKADLVLWRPATGTWHWLTSSSGYEQSAAGSVEVRDRVVGDVPLVGDIDGDGKADLILWRASTGAWSWLTSSSGYRQAGGLMPAPGGDALVRVPLLGDVDADGRAELIVWSMPAGGGARIDWAAASGGAKGFLSWSDRQTGDVPMLADVDRDRKADPIAWRPGSGTWAWLTSSSGYSAAASGQTQWGNQSLGDVPLVADLDGDGAADFAVWRASTRTWYWVTSSSGYNPASARLKPWKF